MESQLSDEMTEPNPDDMHQIMVGKATELFELCDKEQKGFISKRDMQRLRNELSLSPEQLETVFDSLDVDGNGFLTLEEFIDGFGSFVGLKPAGSNNMDAEDGDIRVYEAADGEEVGAEVEKHFQEMMTNVGAKKFFNEDETIKALWVKLRQDEPDLVGHFEDFLNRVTTNIKQSQNDFDTLEAALKSKNTSHDEEIRKLYEEMEVQIKQEKERILKEEKAKEKHLREELEREIYEKDSQLQELLQKHQEMEEKLANLNLVETETKQENEKLTKEKDRLEELLITSQDNLEESRTYIGQLREHEKSVTKERARAALKMNEGIALERESLVKQLDMLRDINRKLRDDKDEAEAAESRRDGSSIALDQELATKALTSAEDAENRGDAQSRRKELTKQGSVLSNYFPASLGRRTSSRASETISEDIDGNLADIEDDLDCDDVYLNNNSTISNNFNVMNSHSTVSRRGPSSRHVKSGYNVSLTESKEENESDTDGGHSRGHNSSQTRITAGERQPPVGETATFENTNGGYELVEPTSPERMFKVVFVGDSGVGKSTYIYQFCHNTFKSTFSATIGVDFQIKTMMSEGRLIALQLWDTAGQERFRSITKQYFRKADGVVVMYDVSNETSFLNVRNWMASVKDGVDDDAVIVIVGNKTDLVDDEKSTITTKAGTRLADEYGALFFETSAKSGSQVKETMEALACLLREKEDKNMEAALKLKAGDGKKKGCCGR